MFTINDSYLEDEVRDGFYIPSISKRAFAAELSLLYELNRICEKYNLKYFADWGSLLGAIRHRGYIPWDDDLDVCMHRNDLKKLIEVADTELPDGFKLYSFENNDYSWKFIYNLVNTERMRFEPEYLKTHLNFPYIATIDIFILDNLTDDEEYEEKRRSDVKFLLNVADLTSDENIGKPEYLNALSAVEKLRGVTIDRKLPSIEIKRFLYKTVQDILAEQNDKDTEYIVQMIPWGIYHNRKIHRSYYEKSVRVPFENTYISVPLKYYSLFLNHKYGRFWEIRMGVGGHGYPYFSKQKESLGTDIDYVPHYKFDEKKLKKDESFKDGSLKSIAAEYAEYLKISYNDILQYVKNMPDAKLNDTEQANLLEYLTQCQENAIQFGTLVDNAKGENTKTVKTLEKYCEYLYEMSQMISYDDAGCTSENLPECTSDSASEYKRESKLREYIENNFKTCTDNILSAISSEITNRRTVVFLPFKGEYFSSFCPFYEMESQNPDTDVYVVALPYYYKEYNGTLKQDIQLDLSVYPENINITDYKDMDLSLIYPDKIYIQNPYDEYNMCISIPDYFYSSNIRNLTDELIYIPWFITSDFNADNYPQNYNMQYYVTVPGVVLSDTVYVSSEVIRSRYIEKLTEFSGEKYEDIWNEKIKITPKNIENCADSADKALIIGPDKKKLCFYTSPSYILEKDEEYFNKLKRCLNIFKESAGSIDVVWHIEPYELDMIKSNDAAIYDKFINILNDAGKTDYIVVDFDSDGIKLAKECAAYYGDGSFISKDFVISGKPVMIMDINIIG